MGGGLCRQGSRGVDCRLTTALGRGGLAHFDRRLCHREGACLTQAGWIEIGAQKWEGVSLTVLEGVLLTQKLDGSWQEEVG